MATKRVIPKAQKLKSGGKPIAITQMHVNKFCEDRIKVLMAENVVMSLNELDYAIGFHRRTIKRALIELIETGYVMDIENNDYEYID